MVDERRQYPRPPHYKYLENSLKGLQSRVDTICHQFIDHLQTHNELSDKPNEIIEAKREIQTLFSELKSVIEKIENTDKKNDIKTDYHKENMVKIEKRIYDLEKKHDSSLKFNMVIASVASAIGFLVSNVITKLK